MVHGHVRRTSLGITGQNLTPEIKGVLHIIGGAEVTQIRAGSPARSSGLLKSDIRVRRHQRIAYATELCDPAQLGAPTRNGHKPSSLCKDTDYYYRRGRVGDHQIE